jgi:ATP synthase protein I
VTEEVRMARGAALATAAAAPVALGLAWWAAGSKGVLGAAFGLVLAIAFFSATLLAVAAVLTFAFKMTVIGLLLFLLRDTTAFDREAFALALVAGTVIYLAAEIRFAMRARIPYVVTDEKKAGSR